MGSISNQVKDRAIAGDLLAQTQWLQDEITEYEDAYTKFTNARKANHPEAELKALRIEQSLEAYDVFGLLHRFARLDHYLNFGKSLISSMEDDPMAVVYVSELLSWLTDDAIGRYLPYWSAKQVSRGRTPITETDVKCVRFGLQLIGIRVLSQPIFELVQELGDRVTDVHNEQQSSKLIRFVNEILKNRERGRSHE